MKQEQQEWEEKFNKDFYGLRLENKTCFIHVKSFIAQEIQKAREEERERIVKIAEETKKKFVVEAEKLDTYLMKGEYENIRDGWAVNGLSDEETEEFAKDRIGSNIDTDKALTDLTNNLTEKK